MRTIAPKSRPQSFGDQLRKLSEIPPVPKGRGNSPITSARQLRLVELGLSPTPTPIRDQRHRLELRSRLNKPVANKAPALPDRRLLHCWGNLKPQFASASLDSSKGFRVPLCRSQASHQPRQSLPLRLEPRKWEAQPRRRPAERCDPRGRLLAVGLRSRGYGS